MGGATPSSSARKVADSRLSRTRTIVWLSWIGIALLTQNGRCRWRRGAVGRRPVCRRGHGRPTAHEVDVVIVPMAGGGAEAGDQVEDLLEPDHYRVRAGPGGDVGALRPVGPLRPPPERLQGLVPTGSEGWCTSRTRDAASPRRALLVGGPVGEPHPDAAVVHRAADGGARLAVVGELVPDAVGGGGTGEQRPVRPGDQVGQRCGGVAAPEGRPGVETPTTWPFSPRGTGAGRGPPPRWRPAARRRSPARPGCRNGPGVRVPPPPAPPPPGTGPAGRPGPAPARG